MFSEYTHQSQETLGIYYKATWLLSESSQPRLWLLSLWPADTARRTLILPTQNTHIPFPVSSVAWSLWRVPLPHSALLCKRAHTQGRFSLKIWLSQLWSLLQSHPSGDNKGSSFPLSALEHIKAQFSLAVLMFPFWHRVSALPLLTFFLSTLASPPS